MDCLPNELLVYTFAYIPIPVLHHVAARVDRRWRRCARTAIVDYIKNEIMLELRDINNFFAASNARGRGDGLWWELKLRRAFYGCDNVTHGVASFTQVDGDDWFVTRLLSPDEQASITLQGPQHSELQGCEWVQLDHDNNVSTAGPYTYHYDYESDSEDEERYFFWIDKIEVPVNELLLRIERPVYLDREK